jgi:putative phosphoesterase
MELPPFIGVVSDTHGYYDPLLDKLFAGAVRIVHAGDIGAGVHDRLCRLAPVTAVLGNTDDPELLPEVPREAEIECLRLRIVIGHIASELLPDVGLRDGRPDVIVTGHSHRAAVQWRESALLLNPGSAGRARFGLPRTAALLFVEDGRVRPEIIFLDRC